MARIDSQRAIPLVLIAIVLALLSARIVVSQMEEKKRGSGDDLVQWVPLDQAEALARESGRPILYDFTADWCAPCHQMKAEVFRNERLAELINDSFVPVRVVDRMREEGSNAPAVDALQQRYSVQGFPTIVIADADGRPRERMEGFRGAAPFEQMMERFR
jgi:thiol:disulfide interchange protein